MKYNNIRKAIFLKRPNRFVAHIWIDEKEEACHVKNTGRLGELLLPGAAVYVEYGQRPGRKTKYSLIAVEKDGEIYNIDSQVPNQLVYDWAFGGDFLPDLTLIKKEKTYKKSRFDLYLETKQKKIFAEVKGVTLNQDGIGLFPDAPTTRGIRHVLELAEAVEEGYEAYIIFVVKFDSCIGFSPNADKHPDFAQALLQAKEKGVHLKALGCHVEPDGIEIIKELPILDFQV